MNKGDKVRIKDTWGGLTSFDGLQGEVVHGKYHVGHVRIKPLSDRPDDHKREEFYWPESKLELIPEEKTFKVGDRVKILGTTTTFLRETVGRLGTVIAAEGNFSLRVDVDDYTHGESGSEWYYDPSKVELVTEEKQTIEVGDTVKATHAESGSVVQGVASFINHDQDNFEINVNENGIGTLDLYTYQGWTFALIAKKEVPKPAPKVGDGFTPGLPVGTALEANTSGLRVFRTTKGWTDHEGFVMEDDIDWNPDVWEIVYLPSE